MVRRMLYNAMYGIYRFAAYGILLVLLTFAGFLLCLLIPTVFLMDVVIPKDILDSSEKAFTELCKSISNRN